MKGDTFKALKDYVMAVVGPKATVSDVATIAAFQFFCDQIDDIKQSLKVGLNKSENTE